jgi:hypothetical protein
MAFRVTLTFASADRDDLDDFVQHICEFGLMGCGVHTIGGSPTTEYEDPEIDYEEVEE